MTLLHRKDALRDLRVTAIVLGFGVLALATLVPVLREPGWPINHDNMFGVRTYIYARHFAALDLMPIWSSVDARGFGSPMPLMYHKLHYIVSAVPALAGLSLKSATAVTIIGFLVVGAVGMYQTMRALGASQLAAAVAGCGLITANYTVTNWQVRGAVAEMSAAMLVPWAFLYFVRSLAARRLLPGFGIVLGLLWLGHSVFGYFVGLLFAIAYLVMAVARAAPWSLIDPRSAWRALVWPVVLVGPYLVPMVLLGREYEFDRILLVNYRPQFQFRPFLSYLWEQHWHFGRTVAEYTTELDHPVLALLIVCGGALAVRRRAASLQLRPFLQPLLPFFLVAGFGLLLQLPISAPFYAHFPGAEFLQFPWRLLAAITPALIVSAVFLADKVLPHDVRLVTLGAFGAWMIAACGAFAPLQDPRITLDPPQLAGLSFSGPGREYEPAAAPPLEESLAAIRTRWIEAGCRYERLDAFEEVRVVRFQTTCGRAAELPLPLYASRAHTVGNSRFGRVEACRALPGVQTLCGAVIPAGESEVWVELPGVWSLVRGR